MACAQLRPSQPPALPHHPTLTSGHPISHRAAHSPHGEGSVHASASAGAARRLRRAVTLSIVSVALLPLDRHVLAYIRAAQMAAPGVTQFYNPMSNENATPHTSNTLRATKPTMAATIAQTSARVQ